MQGIPGPIASLIHFFSGVTLASIFGFLRPLLRLYLVSISALSGIYLLFIGPLFGPNLVFQQTSLAARSMEFS
jgi:chromate transport protein ChrA